MAKKKTPSKRKTTGKTTRKPASKSTGKATRKTTRKPARKTKAQKTSRLRFAAKWLFVIGMWAGIALAGLFAYYAQELPAITEDASFERKRAIIVKAIDGSTVARYGEIVGNKVTVEDIPPYLVQAVLAIEDRRFYHHPGLDPLGLARAMFVNIKEGRVAQGGSTITQQLAKNLFLSQERTYKRKIQEAMLALWLEYELTKDEILSAYLNRVYLGSGVYGVDAAARLYFKAPVKNLTLRECATLAGLLKAPSRYSPLRNPSLSKQRTEVVLNAMVDAGYITQTQAKGDKSIPPKPTQKPTDALADRYYTDWIVDSLDELIGTPSEDLIIETTLNPEIQKYVQDAVSTTIEKNGSERSISQGAMIVMRPNGAVVALIGGRNYSSSQFNRATQAKRPPGSSFKPLVYLTALEQGWDPQSLIMDKPITSGRYRPKNFGNKYYGEVTLEEALTYSLNTVSYQLMKETGPEAVIYTAQRMGITSELEPDLSLALGSSGITLLEMATAYSTIANGGYAVEPFGITKIISKDTGELYYQRPPHRTMKRVFAAHNIQNLTSMMNSVMEYGTGRAAQIGLPAAGKTGTSNDSRDALFMGFTRELVGVVWLGNDDNSPMKHVTGGSFPAQIWASVMRRAAGQYPQMNQSDFAPASGFEELLGSLFFRSERDKELHMQTLGNIQPATGEGRKRSLKESLRYND
ncbi:MAG: PBP1A family penicillin-binding protein [Rhodospirillales bacterium]|nr:PBP1A family penicillin-binding protein [Alphaproteobacteria bacterium]USO05953.1 MAG: PBP1A family penicillin-binding protein [Rhodospirillales bacterium]